MLKLISIFCEEKLLPISQSSITDIDFNFCGNVMHCISITFKIKQFKSRKVSYKTAYLTTLL